MSEEAQWATIVCTVIITAAALIGFSIWQYHISYRTCVERGLVEEQNIGANGTRWTQPKR